MEWRQHWSRFVAAVWLTLLFSFSSLGALTVQAFSATGTACCRTKGECCCHKHQGGAEFSGKTCASDCGHVTLGGIPIAGAALTQKKAWIPALGSGTAVSAHVRIVLSLLSSHSLLQRPPPSLSIVE